jgi:hypothetical protein
VYGFETVVTGRILAVGPSLIADVHIIVVVGKEVEQSRTELFPITVKVRVDAVVVVGCCLQVCSGVAIRSVELSSLADACTCRQGRCYR